MNFTLEQKKQFFIDGYKLGKRDAKRNKPFDTEIGCITSGLIGNVKYEIKAKGYKCAYKKYDRTCSQVEQEFSQYHAS